MKKFRSNIEGICDALNQMGIKTSIPEGVASQESMIARAIRVTREARQKADEEIARIAESAKRSTSN